MCIDRGRRQAGVTLIELIIFMVIVSIAVAGILQMINLSVRLSGDPLRRKQALMLAEGLLEEVELAAFTYCDPTDANAETATSVAGCASVPEVLGPESGNTRPFDNVNDYVSAWGTAQQAFNNASGIVVDAAGNSFNLTGYTAYLTITGTDTLNTITSSQTSAGMTVLRLNVRVNYGTGADDNVVLDGYRTRYSPTVLAQ
jgi:MSHA pilin protein MshD